jgi:hypothetical protein
MKIYNLSFSPHLVWHTPKGFHVFGFNCMTSNNKMFWYNCRHLIIGENPKDISFRVGVDWRAIDYPLNHVFRTKDQTLLLNWTWFFDLDNNVEVYKQHSCFNLIPKCVSRSANFDLSENHSVFAWGLNLLIDKNLIATEKWCGDVKISPDEETIAYSTGSTIHFMDLKTKAEKYALSSDHKIRHMAFSENGDILGVVTSCHKFIMWDVE